MMGGMNAAIALTQPVVHLSAPRIRSLDLAGPAGHLEAVVNEGNLSAPFAALVCHPHPLGGGNLHNKVVYHAMKVLNEPRWGFSFPVLRFNFRGTGISEGVHNGEAEAGDVLAALDWMRSEYNRPIILAGFSFGAAMSIAACRAWTGATGDLTHPSSDVRALIAIGLPTENGNRVYHYPDLERITIPKLFLSGDHDEFAPAHQLSEIAAGAADPKELALIN